MLFPAWLRDLDVDAKLHFPSGPGGAEAGTLHVVLASGKVTVTVVPESRRVDVVVLPLQERSGPVPPAPPYVRPRAVSRG